MFKILIAPDSFKGSLSAIQISRIINEKLSKIGLSIDVISLPLADGGEGSLDAINQFGNFLVVKLKVSGPQLNDVESIYLFDKKTNTAYVELAQASGLALINGKNNILRATTLGTGQLLKHAIEHGAAKIVLFLGGSATCDAGLGIADALGVKFYNPEGENIRPFAENMPEIADFDVNNSIIEGKNIEILLAVDVNNPFYGPNGASYVYSPQKGANHEQVIRLDNGLKHLAELIQIKTGIDLHKVAGSGAAGGTAGGLHAFFDAKIIPGTDFIFNLIGLEEKIKNADLIISGEGKIDCQSLNNKLVFGVSKLCTKYDKKLWAICGYFDGNEQLMNDLFIEKVFSLAQFKDEIAESIANAGKKLEDKVDEMIPFLCKMIGK